jgi:hypothetical protein
MQNPKDHVLKEYVRYRLVLTNLSDNFCSVISFSNSKMHMSCTDLQEISAVAEAVMCTEIVMFHLLPNDSGSAVK